MVFDPSLKVLPVLCIDEPTFLLASTDQSRFWRRVSGWFDYLSVTNGTLPLLVLDGEKGKYRSFVIQKDKGGDYSLSATCREVEPVVEPLFEPPLQDGEEPVRPSTSLNARARATRLKKRYGLIDPQDALAVQRNDRRLAISKAAYQNWLNADAANQS